MRLVLLFVLASSPAIAQSKQKIAILGVEVIQSNATPDKDAVRVAQDYTVALRTRPRSGAGPYHLAANSERDLVDEKLLASCGNEAASCMAKLGANLAADVLMYGKLERKGNAYQVSIKLLDVTKQKMLVGWTDLLPVADASGTKLADHARKGYEKLVGNTSSVPAPPPPPVAPKSPPPPPKPPTGCDHDTLVEKGDAAVHIGTYAAALVHYEQALKCKTVPALYPRAFLASCKARNMAKAKFYYAKMSVEKQRQFAQICVAQGIDLP